MTSNEKLIRRFQSIPADFSWTELVRLLKGLGYSKVAGSGSRRKFKGEGLPLLSLHEPHPGKIVKQYALRYVKDVLEAEGLI